MYAHVRVCRCSPSGSHCHIRTVHRHDSKAVHAKLIPRTTPGPPAENRCTLQGFGRTEAPSQRQEGIRALFVMPSRRDEAHANLLRSGSDFPSWPAVPETQHYAHAMPAHTRQALTLELFVERGTPIARGRRRMLRPMPMYVLRLHWTTGPLDRAASTHPLHLWTFSPRCEVVLRGSFRRESTTPSEVRAGWD